MSQPPLGCCRLGLPTAGGGGAFQMLLLWPTAGMVRGHSGNMGHVDAGVGARVDTTGTSVDLSEVFNNGVSVVVGGNPLTAAGLGVGAACGNPLAAAGLGVGLVSAGVT